MCDKMYSCKCNPICDVCDKVMFSMKYCLLSKSKILVKGHIVTKSYTHSYFLMNFI